MDTVIVTGASRGLGRFCAERLHEAGYKVIGIGRNPGSAAAFEMRQADVADQLEDFESIPAGHAL